MRQIKFRGKRGREWIYGDLVRNELGTKAIVPAFRCDHYNDCGNYEVGDVTVGQYMGRKDKNGREIYEDDVFTVDGKYPKLVGWDEETASFAVANIEDIRRQVEWDVWQHPDKRWWQDFGNVVEVIGNIHDDPELLTQKI